LRAGRTIRGSVGNMSLPGARLRGVPGAAGLPGVLQRFGSFAVLGAQAAEDAAQATDSAVRLGGDRLAG
jgi:hypothetical protein